MRLEALTYNLRIARLTAGFKSPEIMEALHGLCVSVYAMAFWSSRTRLRTFPLKIGGMSH